MLDLARPSMPWAETPERVVSRLDTTCDGLDPVEVLRRLESGHNVLPAPRPPTLRFLVGEQLNDTFVRVLLVAAAVSVAARDATDAVVIAFVVIVNTSLGVIQQRKAQLAVTALQSLSVPTATVVRSGDTQRVDSTQIVAGDVLLVQAGDLVPADARLLEAADLWTDEALLTGESTPIEKGTEAVDPRAPVAERHTMLYGGTLVTRGRGRAVVTATGPDSEVGRLSELVTTATPPRTPLERRLNAFGRRIAVLVVSLCGLVLAIGLLNGEPPLTMTLAAISLAVAAIPESLPAVIAVSLALAARRMAQHSAVVRTLPAVEALGSVTVIASDKTGTLTEGALSVRRVWTPLGYGRVEGVGYAPVGAIHIDAPARIALDQLLAAVALCNDAHLVEEDGSWSVAGDPLEGALLALAARGDVDSEAVRSLTPRVAEIPFAHGRDRMTTLHQLPDLTFVLVTKGAPESVLSLVADDPKEASAAVESFAAEGLRVLAVASGDFEARPPELDAAESGLRLLGVVGLQDPPRAGAAHAVKLCARAGIVPLMITGDHPETAAAIARDLDILVEGTSVMSGHELAAGAPLDANRTRVFARTAPEQKLDIVTRLREAGHVVAMTGDGVNDAPALRQADVGVAMGRSGSDVARQAADVVLLDDDFGTIVAAVQEGRRVYDNIRRFLVYGISGGAAEVLVMLVGPLLGMPLPLLPAQVLWVNLLTHGLPGVALGAERGEKDALRRPPRDPAAGVLEGGLLHVVALLGSLMAMTALATAAVARGSGLPWQSMLVVTLTLQQLWLAVTLRSTRQSLLKTGVRGNPLLLASVVANLALLVLAVRWSPLMTLLGTTTLDLHALALCAVVSLVIPVAVEITKALLVRRTASA